MERNPFSPPAAPVEALPDDPAVPTFLVLARFANVMEAQVLKDLLVAEGIPASLADAHTVQSNNLWANALGGIRLLVPAASLSRARELMSEMQSGALALDGDADPGLPAPVVATERALWNPDVAAVFSLVLTPVFGAVLVLLNERTLANSRGKRTAIAWLTIAIAMVGLAIWRLCTDGSSPSPWLGLRVSGLVLPYTIVWYFFAAHAQSSRIAKAHGRKYVHLSVLRAAPLAVLVMAAAGIASMAL